MEHEATQVVSSSYTSNEFVHATPAYVNENTLAVVVSMRGTKETIVAAQVAKDHGASTIAIYVDESGLTEVCDYKIQYDSLAVDESCMGRTLSLIHIYYIQVFYENESYEHTVFPGAVYVSLSTEYGTLYSKAELAAIHAVCQKREIPLFVDGARLARCV